MQLVAGSRLSSYEIIAPLGAGGMGEVYRARDPALKRDVAIKVLPEDWPGDPEHLQRFVRGMCCRRSRPHAAADWPGRSQGGNDHEPETAAPCCGPGREYRTQRGARRVCGVHARHWHAGDLRAHGEVAVREGPRSLLVQEAFHLEPIGEAIDPVVGGNVLYRHAEAVAALRVHVQFGGFVSRRPLLVEVHAFG